MQEKVKKNLKEFYFGLPDANHPKTEFVSAVVAKTGVSAATVRNWIMYGMKPSNPEHVKVLAEMTGIEEKDLW